MPEILAELTKYGLDIAVSRTAYTKTYRTRSAVTRESDDTYVVSKILTAELCAEALSDPLPQDVWTLMLTNSKPQVARWS